jgi:hypothetical protein
MHTNKAISSNTTVKPSKPNNKKEILKAVRNKSTYFFQGENENY